MKKLLLIISALLCNLAAPAVHAEANQAITYSFVWKNLSPATQCGPLEIKILNNGSVVDQKYSSSLLTPGSSYKMGLSAAYCTRIQLKALCSGSNNFQETGCTSGTIEITSPGGMTFYR